MIKFNFDQEPSVQVLFGLFIVIFIAFLVVIWLFCGYYWVYKKTTPIIKNLRLYEDRLIDKYNYIPTELKYYYYEI